MNASKHSRGGTGNDDISGLFSRFGAAGHAGDYQDFDHPALPDRVAVPAAPPSPEAMGAPLRKPQAAAAAAAPEAAATPLTRLFQRLLQEGASPVRGEGPLRRLLSR